jgi:hypothetical protein
VECFLKIPLQAALSSAIRVAIRGLVCSGRDGIESNEVQHTRVAGQVEKRLRKGTGCDLGQRRNTGAPSPVANSKQCRLIPPGDRDFRSNSFGVVV